MTSSDEQTVHPGVFFVFACAYIYIYIDIYICILRWAIQLPEVRGRIIVFLLLYFRFISVVRVITMKHPNVPSFFNLACVQTTRYC